MGQAANSGRRASLDDKRRRAAGRMKQQGPEREAIRDAYSEKHARGKAGGAFGAEGRADRKTPGRRGEI